MEESVGDGYITILPKTIRSTNNCNFRLLQTKKSHCFSTTPIKIYMMARIALSSFFKTAFHIRVDIPLTFRCVYSPLDVTILHDDHIPIEIFIA